MAIKVDPDLSTLLCHKCIRKNFIFCPRSNILYIIYIYYIYNILYIICIAHTQNTQLYPHHHPDCMEGLMCQVKVLKGEGIPTNYRSQTANISVKLSLLPSRLPKVRTAEIWCWMKIGFSTQRGWWRTPLIQSSMKSSASSSPGAFYLLTMSFLSRNVTGR